MFRGSDLPLATCQCDDFAKEKMKTTETELIEEMTMVKEILKA